MNQTNPVPDLRKELWELATIINGLGTKEVLYGGTVREAYLGAEKVFTSPEFRRYSESFGKLALMAGDRIGDSGRFFFSNFRMALDYWVTISNSIYNDGKIRLLDVAVLLSSLEIMEIDQGHIDTIFAQQ